MTLDRHRTGFSLVELSIVLVIIGLLTGGILAGQSLIRAAEIRAVIAEYQRYSTAVQTFRDKYQATPGDMVNATLFWGKDNASCSSATGTAATPGTCNGNGDGVLQQATATNATGEIFQVWKQLALAGLVEGNYTGLAGPITPVTGYDAVIGVNGPRSRLANAGWSINNRANYAGDTAAYAFDYGNEFIFGATSAGQATYQPVFKPEEAWNIDTKLDDGMPGTGRVIARFWNNLCSNASSNSDYTGTYRLTDSTMQCSLLFPKAL